MTGPVGIIGVGEAMYDSATDRSLEELVHRTAREALDDAGLDRSELESVVACASDLEDGRAISSMVTAGPAGSYNRDFIKTTDTGIHALGLATMRIETGVFDTSLVVSWAKHSETDLGTIRQLEGDPFYRRGTGLGYLTGHAAQAAGYVESSEDAIEAADRVVAKNTSNRRSNPRAVTGDVMSDDDAAATSVEAWPIRESHLPPYADGAFALVLGGESVVDATDADPVWIQGIGWETDTYSAGNRRPGGLSALSGAAEMSYDDAGIEAPVEAIDLAEVHAKSAFHELMILEALDVTATSAATESLSGVFDQDGRLPVAPSGGSFAGDALIATGLARVTEAVRQVRGAAGNCQIPSADRALAHSCAGFTDQTHGVAVLGGEPT